MRCISSAANPSAPITTATGFPKNGFCVKTSTCLKGRVCMPVTLSTDGGSEKELGL